MITLDEARALKVGDPVILTDQISNTPRSTTVSYNENDRLHVDQDNTQFILENCQGGIPSLSLPITT
jgi:hypothetical protein